MKQSDLLTKIKNGRIEILGLGVSNRHLPAFLFSHGAKNVTVRDSKTREKFAELPAANDALAEAERAGAGVILGEGYLEGVSGDVIFRSPGIRPDLPRIVEAVHAGAVLTSEMELFLELTPATVIGVTGSDGKTTTTTLTGLLLTEACRAKGSGHVYIGGNIGTPLLPEVEKMTADDFAVAELSSFQLQTVRRSPDIAAVTNVSPNHLNWHTGMEEYIAAKTNIYAHEPNRRLVTNAENGVTRDLAAKTSRPLTLFSSVKHHAEEFPLRPGDKAVYERDGMMILFDGKAEKEIVSVDKIILPGRHNLENYMTAVALTDGFVSPGAVERIASTFPGVRHRLERIRVLDGVTYYNSSIDSSPTRTEAALSALREKPIVICGGYDKHIPFAPLAEALFKKAKAVILTGATAEKIAVAIKTEAKNHAETLPVFREPEFLRAVCFAREIAKPGDTVLLSPACASFDAFRNFEERGDTFRAIVENF